MRVWIDLSNSPHPLLFAPVARALQAQDHTVLVSARDNAQTVELARERWPEVELIGEPSPRGRAGKAKVMAARVARLTGWARRRKVDVALSHNSYGQILAARALRLPVVTAMDFEHQPANHLAFRLADAILLPEALRGTGVERQGASSKKTRFYPGLKEEIYLADFQPDHSVLRRLGLRREPDKPIVVLRTPPSRAVYHRFDNPVFGDLLDTIGRDAHARCVILTRHPEQRRAIEALGLPNVVVPTSALDSRSLMWTADLVIGAGGTMTREAALLGTPTVSVFAGEEPAVDAWLRERGWLRRLGDASELGPIECRSDSPASLEQLRERSETLVCRFVDAVELVTT
jgi:uncharacterized protein